MTNNRSKLLQISFAVLTVMSLYIGAKEVITSRIIADDSDTSVDVGSTAPSFTVAPAENPASDATNPINDGDSITFQATATDANDDDYYLAICDTNSITPGSGSAPTCGNLNYCISSATASGAQASCIEAVSPSSQNNIWFAFVCDGSACSSSNQGSGSSGSPFKVNRRADSIDFSTLGGTAFDPGATITFKGEGNDYDDDTTPDTVKIIVCDSHTATADASGCLTGNLICQSSLTAADPTCTYDLPEVIAWDASVEYKMFMFDNHGFEAQYSDSQNGTYSINNSFPTVSSVTLNSGSDITLTESSNTNVVITGTVNDANSCQDVNISNVKANLSRSALTYTGCDTAGENNSNNCYAEVTCTITGNTCSGPTDSSISVSCTVAVKHYADPTTTSTQYPSENWEATIDVVDNGSLTNEGTATSVELNSLIALNATNSISYGSLAAGANTGATNQSVVVSATGNVGLDTELSGTDMEFSTYTIPVGNQEFSTSTFTYGAGTDLSSSATEVELNVQKTTTDTPATKTLYWGIGLPAIVGAGTYTGTNTLTAVLGETVGW